ncbi:MAG: AmmeMemoRadiSam system protein A [Deltaproteobacteria bacterium]|nr:AmmeMemoRadiSam system protein A [Deltaproteobacteria bacterium]
MERKPHAHGLSAADKVYLKELAAARIKACLESREEAVVAPKSEILKEKRGGFVTLYKAGHLRGCIGYVEAFKPLYLTVEEMALAAAFRDPRFPKLQLSEWPDIKIEISVLSPLVEIEDPNLVEVGKHGLLLRQGSASGLLLPQVATEYGWTREEFLTHTCHKAGLPADCWRRPGIRIYVFTADVF